jgi:hypothetical protein
MLNQEITDALTAAFPKISQPKHAAKDIITVNSEVRIYSQRQEQSLKEKKAPILFPIYYSNKIKNPYPIHSIQNISRFN